MPGWHYRRPIVRDSRPIPGSRKPLLPIMCPADPGRVFGLFQTLDTADQIAIHAEPYGRRLNGKLMRGNLRLLSQFFFLTVTKRPSRYKVNNSDWQFFKLKRGVARRFNAIIKPHRGY